MAASARKNFSATRNNSGVKNGSSSQRGAITCPLPRRPCLSPNLSEHSPSSNRAHSWADNGEHSRWHTKASEDSPQKGSVDGGVKRFVLGKVEKAQAQRGCPPSARVFLQASYDTANILSTVDLLGGLIPRCAPGKMFSPSQHPPSEATREMALLFEEHFVGVSHEGNATIVDTLYMYYVIVGLYKKGVT